jgi:hypothetical protein
MVLCGVLKTRKFSKNRIRLFAPLAPGVERVVHFDSKSPTRVIQAQSDPAYVTGYWSYNKGNLRVL